MKKQARSYRKKVFISLAVLLITLMSTVWCSDVPKHELRAAWVATVLQLDFPDPTRMTSSEQQADIVDMLDNLQEAEFNAVVFQIRPECDAFYESSYEPWSRHLTGNTTGAAPAPFYDPLQFMIQEAHKRGMELHAWFNPFRLSTTSNLEALPASHIYKEHPEWKLNHSTLMLDPGIPAVRNYTVDVFMDVVNRYDIDAVHMDDYFYPYAGMAQEDIESFTADQRGFSDMGDWRRDNINRFIAALYDSIQSVKPWVKLGISPFGIWKSGIPTGISGTSSYSKIYCDPIAWLNDGTVDYITPQLYWPFDQEGQDYALLMPWWADQTSSYGRHLYVGHSPYRITDYHDWPNNELPNQIRLNRKTEGSLGSVLFRLGWGILDNPKGFLDSLKNDLYRYPAIPPAMPWKDDIMPNPPKHISVIAGTSNTISWDRPDVAADGDTAFQYVIYRSGTGPVDINLVSNILDIIPATVTSYVDASGSSDYYAITALDRLKNESDAAQGIVSVDEIATIPEEIILYPNFPNPFNPSTVLSFSINQSQEIELNVFDIRGAHIRDVFSGFVAAGQYQFNFDSHAADGGRLEAGVYLVRLETEMGSKVKRMLLLK
ncbi:MAG: family 10 glycosylhydrolase [Candidatus Marinimicrobia bacterium]|nr:family 10 glycosylhydrolase [Candidatus Neomarinimicrobiota bacterium]